MSDTKLETRASGTETVTVESAISSVDFIREAIKEDLRTEVRSRAHALPT